jgi:hypothetical protein
MGGNQRQLGFELAEVIAATNCTEQACQLGVDLVVGKNASRQGRGQAFQCQGERLALERDLPRCGCQQARQQAAAARVFAVGG